MTRWTSLCIALIGAVAAVLTSCSTDAAELDTAQAALVLETLVANPSDAPLLDDCPFDPLGALLREALAEVDSLDVVRGLRGDFESAVFPFDDEADPGFVSVSCSRFLDNFEAGFGIDAALAPDEFDTYLTALIGPEPDEFLVDQQPPVDHRGGRFERFCARDLVEDQNSFCEVSWMNDEVLITLYVVGADTDLDDLASIEAGLAGVLDRIIENLAAAR